MKQEIKILKSESGQAMVEYILLVIITVSLVLAARGLFSGMNNFMTNYLGGYFKCLMVYGELPALGVSEGDLKKHTSGGYTCKLGDNKFQDLAQGSAGGVKGGNQGTKGDPEKDPNLASQRERYQKNSSEAGSQGKGSIPRSESSSSNRSKSGVNRTERGGRVADSGGDEESEGRIVSLGPSQQSNLRSERARKISLDGQTTSKTRKVRTEAEISKRNKVVLKEDDDGSGAGSKPRLIKPRERSTASITDENDDTPSFTIGNLFKWLVIIGIGIIIFIVVGSQFMNYRNSDSG